MKRRQFIKKTGATMAYACCMYSGIAVLEGCTPLKYVNTGSVDGKVTVSKTEFESLSFVLVKVEGLKYSIYLRKDEDERYTGLLTECTHKGCEVKPAGNQMLVCPCHGAEFSCQGEVLKSPAKLPLRKFKTESDEKNVYIYL